MFKHASKEKRLGMGVVNGLLTSMLSVWPGHQPLPDSFLPYSSSLDLYLWHCFSVNLHNPFLREMSHVLYEQEHQRRQLERQDWTVGKFNRNPHVSSFSPQLTKLSLGIHFSLLSNPLQRLISLLLTLPNSDSLRISCA